MNKMYSTSLLLAIMVIALSLTTCKNVVQKEVPQDESGDSDTAVVYHNQIKDRLYLEFDSAEIYNDSIIKGYWFKAHEAPWVNVFFHKDNTFEFNFYTVNRDKEVIDLFRKGTYTIDGYAIRMVADEGWEGTDFDGILFHKHNGTNYVLTDKYSSFFMVKGG